MRGIVAKILRAKAREIISGRIKAEEIILGKTQYEVKQHLKQVPSKELDEQGNRIPMVIARHQVVMIQCERLAYKRLKGLYKGGQYVIS